MSGTSYQTEEAQLRALRAGWPSGEVKIVTDRRPVGRGLRLRRDVEHEQAQAAVAALNGKPFGGRPITVSEARERATGGGGGGRGDYPRRDR
jgi:RNA recognition motif-containing protein